MRQELMGECGVESSSPRLSMGNTFQEPLWIPEIIDNVNPYI